MFATISYDGFICVYILPNKLITMIKNQYDNYYDKIFLSSNPFPSIIAYKKEKYLISYSLSGMIIKKYEMNNKIDFEIIPLFNMYGGAFKDRINLISKKGESKLLDVPFFNISEVKTTDLYNNY